MNDIFVILVNYMKELEGKKFRMNINIIGLVTRRNQKEAGREGIILLLFQLQEGTRRKQEEKEYEYYEDYYYEDYPSACGIGELDVKVKCR